ncbi:hypothetical protein CC79DRAFT_1394406 [Sarocladium strictum]
MRLSVFLSTLFIAVAAAGTITSEHNGRSTNLDILAKRCQCVCNENSCEGPGCCANGSCSPDECANDQGRKAMFLAKSK